MKDAEIIADAIRSIASGTTHGGPNGLELLAMAFCRNGEPSISKQIGYVSDSLDRIADRLEYLEAISVNIDYVADSINTIASKLEQ